jgi:hypothetical protein
MWRVTLQAETEEQLRSSTRQLEAVFDGFSQLEKRTSLQIEDLSRAGRQITREKEDLEQTVRQARVITEDLAQLLGPQTRNLVSDLMNALSYHNVARLEEVALQIARASRGGGY